MDMINAVEAAWQERDSFAMLQLRDTLRRADPRDVVALRVVLMDPRDPDRCRWIHGHFSRVFAAALRTS